MAKKIKEEQEAKPVKKIRYLAKYLNFGFDYPAVDENGKPKVKKNAQGEIQYNTEGDAIPIHLHAKFQAIQTLMSKGYLSFFDFDPSDETAQNVALGKTLEKLDNDQGVKVTTQDKYDAEKNPDMYAERARAESLAAENAELRAKLDSPEELERRLSELTAPK
jgi:hypothetical protein